MGVLFVGSAAAGGPPRAKPAVLVAGRMMTGTLTLSRHEQGGSSDVGSAFSMDASATTTLNLPLNGSGPNDVGYLGSGSIAWHHSGSGHLLDAEPCSWNQSGTSTGSGVVGVDLTGTEKGYFSIGFGPDSVEWDNGDCIPPDASDDYFSVGTSESTPDTVIGYTKSKATISGTQLTLRGSQTWPIVDSADLSVSGSETVTWNLTAPLLNRCEGKANRIASVWSKSGRHYGLGGTQLAMGEVITAAENIELTLGDGSALRLAKGTQLKVDSCAASPQHRSTREVIELVLGKIWASVSKSPEPQIQTQRAVTGTRGTKYWVAYNPAKQLTTVHVTKGSVSMRNRYGKSKTLIIKAGQTGIQQGNQLPKLKR